MNKWSKIIPKLKLKKEPKRLTFWFFVIIRYFRSI